MRHPRTLAVVLAVAMLMPFAATAKLFDKEVLLEDANTALQGMLEDTEQGIPTEIVEKCVGVAVFPGVKKVGFGIGVRRGHGVVMAKNDQGDWSAPAFFTLTGASTGWQAGAQAMDIVLFFMNEKTLNDFLTKQFTVGADAAVAAGPDNSTCIDSNASTRDLASILSYTKIKRGLFAGVAIKGARISFDEKQTEQTYQTDVTAEEIVLQGKVAMPDGATDLARTLSEVPGKVEKTARK